MPRIITSQRHLLIVHGAFMSFQVVYVSLRFQNCACVREREGACAQFYTYIDRKLVLVCTMCNGCSCKNNNNNNMIEQKKC